MKLRPFELILVVVFAGLGFLTLVLLSNYSGNGGDDDIYYGSVEIWGTLEQSSVSEVLQSLYDLGDAYKGVRYRYIDPRDFDTTLVTALADGEGPDAILVSHERLVDYRKRIAAVSYESYPLRDIKNTYIDGAEIYALSDGLYAYPIAVDPLVMYWNRDMFSNKGLLNAPKTWEELVNVQFDSLIERDFDRTIKKSVVAMGEYGNVRNAFGIISTLLLQAGTRGVIDEGNLYRISINESVSGAGKPLQTSLDFYTRFSRVNNSLYSWNRSFVEDRSQFAAEDLAMYFGYGSEGYEIERLNPNLNFDIAEVPQGQASNVRRTYGKFYGFSVLRSSDNLVGAATAVSMLANQNYGTQIARANNMAPVFRSTLSQGSNDTYGRVIYQAATVAYGWLNPSLTVVADIFTTMTRDVNENRYDEGKAASDAIKRLEQQYY